MPLPRQAIIAIDRIHKGELGNQPTVATNAAVAPPCSPDPDISAAERKPIEQQSNVAELIAMIEARLPARMNKEGELGNQPTVTTLKVVVAAAESDPDKNKASHAQNGSRQAL